MTAWLTTASAPGYSLPAIVTGSDWATATAGATVKLAANTTGLIAATGIIGEQNVTSYGCQLGLNVSF